MKMINKLINQQLINKLQKKVTLTREINQER